jgi:hypothetical protein
MRIELRMRVAIRLPRPVKTQDAIKALRKYGHDLYARRECDQMDFDLWLGCKRCGDNIGLSWRTCQNHEVEYSLYGEGAETYCERLRVLWG